ncbi:MAG: capsular polysaccharide biosynthesis protein [Cocleimonas sp.]|nr:capsular polysaccharide biosynthesis protein [Cocleimonas sp.]
MNKKANNIGVFSSGIMKIPTLTTFLNADKVFHPPSKKVDTIMGWGRKANTAKAIKFASQHKLPYLILEDGFLHSCGQGVLGDTSCSMIVDHTGIYYDACTPSDLEILLAANSKLSFDNELIKRATTCIQQITKHSISKYNNTALSFNTNLIPEGKNILVIDQTAGDMSLEHGYINNNTFDNMLQAALDEHPNATIIIKTHPDVIAGKKKGCLSLDTDHPRIIIIADNINPLALMSHVEHVYVATSQMGFEALMLGKPVTCFGVPFYSGWGLTDDRANSSLDVWTRRKNKLTLEQMFAAAYIRYTRYIHPDTLERCEIEDILDYFTLQQQMRLHASSKSFCFGFTLWKLHYIRGFLQSPDNEIHFVSSSQQAIKKGFDASCQIILWASKDKSEAIKLSEQFNVPLQYMEDGFIRSIGIGTDLTAPASLVLDRKGVYFNPSSPSDLEYLLQTYKFESNLLERAKKLRALLLEAEVSKYNLGKELSLNLIQSKPEQTIILIPGQVEDDASIQVGCIDICTNSKLIMTVRENNPDAYLIFKPHPDVISGNRKGAVANETIDQYCDLMLDDISITDCLGIADEVHTMTSLVGFEGLLRELKVVCYGLPFYSNWGLTQDRHYLKRRNPEQKYSISLDKLVAATLILYPRYINWQTGAYTTPEFIVQQIKQRIEQQGGKQANKIPAITRKLRQAKQLIKGIMPN